MNLLPALADQVGTTQACAGLGLSRATLYRQRRPKMTTPCVRVPPLKLSEAEQTAVLDELMSPRFVDRAPHQVYATLLDEGRYLCSIRTMYRLLEQQHAVRERRAQRVHPVYARPELMASAPNQLWSWDITKLRTTVKWSYLYLYVVLDVYSRYIVGWLLSTRESAQLARELVEQTGGEGHIWLHLSAEAALPMTCQRCLTEARIPLYVDRSFRFVADEATAEMEDDDSDEDLLAMSREFNLLELIEDELLMEVPVVPRHEECPVPVQMESSDADFEQANEQKENPFAVLQSLNVGKSAD